MSTTEASSKNDYATFGRKQSRVEVEGVGNSQTPRTMERSSSLDSIQTTSLVAVPESALESNGSHPPKTRYYYGLFRMFEIISKISSRVSIETKMTKNNQIGQILH